MRKARLVWIAIVSIAGGGPLRKASRVNISLRGTAKPTVALKKMRISQRMIRLSWVTHTWCERGTLTKHMPATKAPSRCEPTSEPDWG